MNSCHSLIMSVTVSFYECLFYLWVIQLRADNKMSKQKRYFSFFAILIFIIWSQLDANDKQLLLLGKWLSVFSFSELRCFCSDTSISFCLVFDWKILYVAWDQPRGGSIDRWLRLLGYSATNHSIIIVWKWIIVLAWDQDTLLQN